MSLILSKFINKINEAFFIFTTSKWKNSLSFFKVEKELNKLYIPFRFKTVKRDDFIDNAYIVNEKNSKILEKILEKHLIKGKFCKKIKLNIN